MYCKYCGKILDDDSKFCSNCGNSVNLENKVGQLSDKSSEGFAILGFFIPIVGLILYLVYEHKQPKRAKSAGKGALIGFIVIVVLNIILTSSMMKSTSGNIDINTYGIDYIQETSDFDVEFGDFKVSNNGYTYDTSLEVSITNNSDKQKSLFVTVEAVDKDGRNIYERV